MKLTEGFFVAFGFELTLFFYFFIATLFRYIFSVSAGSGLIFVSSANIVLLYFLNPLIVCYLALQIVLVISLYFLMVSRGLQNSTKLCWVAFLGLLPMNFAGGLLDGKDLFAVLGRLGVEGVFWTFGSSFFVIKSFVMLKEAVSTQKFSILSALAGLTFLPSFAAGPIHGQENWKVENIKKVLYFCDYRDIFFKIGWGAASLYVIAPFFRSLSKEAAAKGGAGYVADVYFNFIALFFDFSGYTLLAISLAAMFGVGLPENFNRPYLATNIRQFWQRWHMSLNWFIGTFLFKPFVRKTGSQKIGILLAFICAGLWHKLSVSYFLWGVGHGVALVLVADPPRLWKQIRSRVHVYVWAIFSWFCTMTWVASLSYLVTKIRL